MFSTKSHSYGGSNVNYIPNFEKKVGFLLLKGLPAPSSKKVEFSGVAYVGIHDRDKIWKIDDNTAEWLKTQPKSVRNKHPFVRRSSSQLLDISNNTYDT